MKELRSAIVTDLGFGDSGKGLTVDYLCANAADKERTLVVRASSGHQVGHTVQIEGLKHTFSNTGSGTLRGVPTYYTQNTVHFPPALLAEAHDLAKLGFLAELIVHPLAMLATPYDILWNHFEERKLKHGSVGVGYGATVRRNNANVTLSMIDATYPWLLEAKLEGVRLYYEKLAKANGFLRKWRREASRLSLASYCCASSAAANSIKLLKLEDVVSKYDYLIFEGNQGIMLDKHNGIQPHTTWADCTSGPAFNILRQLERYREIVTPDVYYITRSYQTRHGAGPMSGRPIGLKPSKDEINVFNEWQGNFKLAALDPKLLGCAMVTDNAYIDREITRNLMITCMDQLSVELSDIVPYLLPLYRVLGSFSPDSKYVKILG